MKAIWGIALVICVGLVGIGILNMTGQTGWYGGRVPLNDATISDWHRATERDRVDTSKVWIAVWMGRENYEQLGPEAEVMIALNAKHLAECVTNTSKPWAQQPDGENTQAADLASTCLNMADDIPRADKFK
ncbi:12-oxophytodienoate reductase, putative [Tepidicaulis marinus]|uniref:12-oxophytodienoate reductase, putative n=1 Tax=Tepidicaulis marinus TaxID=1333998 RepID=A0A081B6C3_9HYPH|nr:hypothetical protein [Tepidicaulis marinus]GAK43591.1 12-oxophytodienoate reductase, putative [Tepidicaulis marinus]